jgi:hypothetical protein
MPKLKLVKKVDAVLGGATLELSVTKKLGPVSTFAEVGSSGTDDGSFSDSQLTPGPAVMPIDAANTYSIAWAGTFVEEGSVTLRVRVLDPADTVLVNKTFVVQGKARELFFRLILVP